MSPLAWCSPWASGLPLSGGLGLARTALVEDSAVLRDGNDRQGRLGYCEFHFPYPFNILLSKFNLKCSWFASSLLGGVIAVLLKSEGAFPLLSITKHG